MFEDLFLRKKLCIKRLLEYGFVKDAENYCYSKVIMDGSFLLQVIIDRLGKIDTTMTEVDSGDEYILYKTTAQGVFVGNVREAVEAVLIDIADKCFDSDVFKQMQTLQLTEYAAKAYGDRPEFLWKDTPDNAILRRKDSGKWYCAILTVSKRKLGIDSDEIVEVVNLHALPEAVERLLCLPAFYPGWHMNKRTWYTVILDGSLPNEELFKLVNESYRLAKKPNGRKQ